MFAFLVTLNLWIIYEKIIYEYIIALIEVLKMLAREKTMLLRNSKHARSSIRSRDRQHRRTGEFFLLLLEGGSRAQISRKILLNKNILMIRSAIKVLPLIFTYFIICLRDKKNIITTTLKPFLCKTISTLGMQLIKE